MYGCCPVGDVCVGDGGSQFIDEKIGGGVNGEGGDDDRGSPVGSDGAVSGVRMDAVVLVVVGAGLLGFL